MAAKPGKRFCVEHGGIQEAKEDGERIPCPYNPKHTCYLKKLQKHMNKCNSRPKVLEEYIIPQINALDPGYPAREVEACPISSVPDDVLIDLIGKIESVFEEYELGIKCESRILQHDVMNPVLMSADLGMNRKKHLLQNSSLLKNMEDNGFFKSNATFIEFGAGKGLLGFWVTQAIEKYENCSLLLIDRASHRHKTDNKLKGVSPVSTLRIRADIADVELGKIPFLNSSSNDIFGVTKHLCGVATDLALRCMINGKSNGLNIRGLAMAFCCHHRCNWNSFVGKQFLIDVGFSPNLFTALCGISSWATCGSGKPRERVNNDGDVKKLEDDSEEEKQDIDRYKKLGLSQELREEIGRKCKMVLNYSRLKYLENFGFEGKLIYYVEQNVSPENVCIVAKTTPNGR